MRLHPCTDMPVSPGIPNSFWSQESYVSRRFRAQTHTRRLRRLLLGLCPRPRRPAGETESDMSLSYLNLNAGASGRGRLRADREELSMGHGLADGAAINYVNIERECTSCENGTCEGCLVNPGLDVMASRIFRLNLKPGCPCITDAGGPESH